MMETQTVTGPPVESDVRSVLRAQRRRRRVRFWAGFLVILLVGGLWAGLTRDPARPGILGPNRVDQAVFVDQGVEFAPPPAVEVFATTTMIGPPPAVDDPVSTTPPTTAPPTTVAPTTTSVP